MVNQLLAMTRAKDKAHAASRRKVNLARLATETVRDFVRELIRNLVDNALQ